MDVRTQLLKSAMATEPVPVLPEKTLELSSTAMLSDPTSIHIKMAALPDQVSDPDSLFPPASREELIKIAEHVERAKEVLQPEVVEDNGRILLLMKNASTPIPIVSVDITEAFLKFAAQ